MNGRAVLLLIVVLGWPVDHAGAQQSVIAPSRRIDWSAAGVPGGIPARTTICATLSAGATVAQINTAIAGCPSGQTVKLNAGTYILAAGINFNNKSNVTLRGAGSNATFLVFQKDVSCHGIYTAFCLDSTDTNYNQAPSNTANWTAGYVKGTTSITLSSKSNLAVGHPLTLDQRDDSSDGGDTYACASAACATAGDGGSPRSGRVQQQIVTVTSISSGACPCVIGITPGLYMPNWRTGQTPQAWWPTSPISMSGVEDLSADYRAIAGTGAGFAFFNCNGCWAKGVRGIMATRAHVRVYQSNRVTIRDSYFYENVNHGTTSYGLEFFPGSDVLVENNILQATTAPFVLSGSCSGCVFAYNFSVNNRYTLSNTWQSHESFMHGGGDDFVLLEGNHGVGIYSDTFHGTHHFVTAFRNRYNGFMPNGGTTTTGNTTPIRLDSFSRFYNIIGNVLGSTSRPHTTYQGSSDQTIYGLGGGNGVPDDSRVAATLMRWGNYDVVNAGNRFVDSEVPSGITNYANPVPSTQGLPASMYLSARPNWWPSGKPWPAVGPDISGGNVPNVGGHAYTIPAQDCYLAMGGPEDGTGAVLAFSPGSCYARPPTAPTGVQVR